MGGINGIILEVLSLSAVARVGHKHCVLPEPVQADVLRVWHARRRPAARPLLLLIVVLPEGEDGARVREDVLLDVREEGLRGAAAGQDGQAAEADLLDRAVEHLQLAVDREDRVGELRRFVPADGHHTLARGELGGRHRLAGQRHLAALDLAGASARRGDLRAGHHQVDDVLHVRRDRRRRHAAPELRQPARVQDSPRPPPATDHARRGDRAPRS
eukprot:4125036-Prymnesium_polylepis.1